MNQIPPLPHLAGVFFNRGNAIVIVSRLQERSLPAVMVSLIPSQKNSYRDTSPTERYSSVYAVFTDYNTHGPILKTIDNLSLKNQYTFSRKRKRRRKKEGFWGPKKW